MAREREREREHAKRGSVRCRVALVVCALSLAATGAMSEERGFLEFPVNAKTGDRRIFNETARLHTGDSVPAFVADFCSKHNGQLNLGAQCAAKIHGHVQHVCETGQADAVCPFLIGAQPRGLTVPHTQCAIPWSRAVPRQRPARWLPQSTL